tara:strand:- start:153 stop:1001 length:849 start_codon:yes stop_codon:yes gene_type:complete
MSKLKHEFTVVLVSYKSRQKISKLINKFKKKIKIIIIENSNDRFLQKKFLNYKNINFYFPIKNKGFAAGLNLGLKKANTKYILYLDIDTKINVQQIFKLYNKAKKISNFGVITTKIKNQDYSNLILGKDKKTSLSYVSFNTGCVMFFNRKNFINLGGFDENYFLYFEEADFYLRSIKANKKIFLYEDVIVEHEGMSSIDKLYKKKYDLLRSWHYCWSKFYFYRKHYNYLFAFVKTIPNLTRSIKGIFKNLINADFYKMKLHLVELKGLSAAYLRLNSYYRMK